MRLEITRGRVVNQRPDDSDQGEWYPYDTNLALIDEAGRPVANGSPRVAAEQALDWPARAGRTWDAERRLWVESEPGAILGARKRALRAEIDEVAGEVRTYYITAAPGQEGTYLLKREEAQAYQAAGSPDDATDWPFVQARAEAFDEPPSTAAQVIVAKARLWSDVGAHIEREREKGKRLTTEAVDEAEAVEARKTARSILLALRPGAE